MNKKKKIAWGVRISSIGLATGMLSYMLYTNDSANGTQQKAVYSSYPNSGEKNNDYYSGNTPDFGAQNQQPRMHGTPNQNGGFDTTTGGT